MRVCWRWLCCGALALLVGCGTSSNGGGGGTPHGNVVASALQGYVVPPTARASGVTLSATAPAGGGLAGAAVKVVDRHGATLAATVTAADGGFELTAIPFAGTTQLTVTPSGGVATTFWVTLVNARTVHAGQVFAFNRALAVAAVQALAPAGALVAVTQNPLPANTEVHPTFGDANSAQIPDTAAHLTLLDEWLGLIDPTPTAPFSHPVRYVFVDAAGGAVTTMDDQAWLPSVNFVPMWDYERDLLRYVGTLPSAHALLTAADPVAAGAVVASPDVVSFPPSTPLPRQTPGAAARQGGNPDYFALIWIGVPEVWFLADESRVNTWFQSIGVPSDHIWAKTGVLYNVDDPMVPPLRAETALTPGLGLAQRTREAALGFTAVEAAVRKRRAEGGFPTLFVWAESHGDKSGRLRDLDLDEGIGSTAYNLALKIGSFFSSDLKKITPPEITALPLRYIDDVLPIHLTSACDVRAWAATCFSYNHLQRWRANFLSTQHDVILYSSSGDVPSRGNGFISQFDNYFHGDETHFTELGLNFTRQVTGNTPPAYTPYASPPGSTGPQTWARRTTCRPATPGR